MKNKNFKKLLRKLRSVRFQKKVMKVPKSVIEALKSENLTSEINKPYTAKFLASLNEDDE